MLISEDIFRAFLRCETKSYLKFLGSTGNQREFTDWERNLVEDYKQQCYIQLRSNFREDECLIGTLLPQALENNMYRLVIDCVVHAQESQSHIHALERLASPGKTKHHTYIPLRFVPSEKITKHDKLLLAFDAFVFSTAFGKAPLFGKIIHGHEQVAVKVELAELMAMAKTIVGKIAAQQTSQTPPPLVLNKHCAECEFKAQCRQVAIEKDDLSLISSMTEKERKQQHNKGSNSRKAAKPSNHPVIPVGFS